MSKNFIPTAKITPHLETVYISQEAKAFIREMASDHGVPMVAIVDDMVNFCKAYAPKKRPNALHTTENN